MTDTTQPTQQTTDQAKTSVELEEKSQFAYAVLKHAASLTVVRIDRDAFLRAQLAKHLPHIDVEQAIAMTPARAGATLDELDTIADAIINFEVKKCSGISFLAGIPGGFAALGTIPADLAQYFGHVLRIEQQLAYIYGWQSFIDADQEIDDETLFELILLMGVMLKVGGAASAVSALANVAQQEVTKRIANKALTKTTYYPVIKRVLRMIGIKVTKESFAKNAGKFVPLLGGVLSGGMTWLSFKPAAHHLKKYLRSLPQARGLDAPVKDQDFLEEFIEAEVVSDEDMQSAE